jgi:hypothetical protein
MDFAAHERRVAVATSKHIFLTAKDEMRDWFLFSLLSVCVIVASGSIVHLRDAGYGGPHHDEVIALLAANALERDYGIIEKLGTAPIGKVVPAVQWHQWTSFQRIVPFREIGEDVLENDKHPPLAFWLLNRWLSLFDGGGYAEAVWFSWLQIVCAAVILGLTVFRLTRSRSVSLTLFAVFLFGNSAVFTSAWVRQYSLFALFYSALIFCALEYSRKALSLKWEALLASLIGLISIGGMLTQYTFATMSLPIHLAVVFVAAKRRGWQGFIAISGVYAIAGTIFLLILPGSIHHATTVSQGIARTPSWITAFSGLAEMLVPIPGMVPATLKATAGVGILILLVGLVTAVLRRECGRESCGVKLSVPLVGVFGAGVIQVLLVGFGFFPAWGTGANHTCALWLLTCLLAAVLVSEIPQRWRAWSAGIVLAGLVAMQVIFIWHTHRILPRLNTLYPNKLNPDLVILDNLARGYVLQVTDVLAPGQSVLVAENLSERFRNDTFGDAKTILYLPMEDSVPLRKASVLGAAKASGWTCEELPVIHGGVYEAILLQHVSDTDLTVDK